MVWLMRLLSMRIQQVMPLSTPSRRMSLHSSPFELQIAALRLDHRRIPGQPRWISGPPSTSRVTRVLPPTSLIFRRKGGLRQPGQGGEHLPCLIAVVVDGLLAQQHRTGLLAAHERLQGLGHRERLPFVGGLDQDGAVGARSSMS